MTDHTVASFDEDLAAIDRLIRAMGEMAGTMLEGATRALVQGDAALAQRIVSDDMLMDERQNEIDEKAVNLIARRQPMAQDLRFVVGAIRMSTDLERIGDLAKNIAKRVAVTTTPALRKHAHGIEAMAGLVLGQVKAAIDRYAARDAEGLSRVRDEDEAVDIQYNAVFRELLTYMMEDPRSITACAQLLFCAKNLERIGDHVTNIVEDSYYVITGQQLPIWRPKREDALAQPDGD